MRHALKPIAVALAFGVLTPVYAEDCESGLCSTNLFKVQSTSKSSNHGSTDEDLANKPLEVWTDEPAAPPPSPSPAPKLDPFQLIAKKFNKNMVCMQRFLWLNPILASACTELPDNCVENFMWASANNTVNLGLSGVNFAWEQVKHYKLPTNGKEAGEQAWAVGGYMANNVKNSLSCIQEGGSTLLQGTLKSVGCASLFALDPQMRARCEGLDASCLDKVVQAMGDMAHFGWDLTLAVNDGMSKVNKAIWDPIVDPKKRDQLVKDLSDPKKRDKMGDDIKRAFGAAQGVLEYACSNADGALTTAGVMANQMLKTMGDYMRCPRWKTTTRFETEKKRISEIKDPKVRAEESKKLEEEVKKAASAPVAHFFSPFQETTECAVPEKDLGPWTCRDTVLTACTLLAPLPLKEIKWLMGMAFAGKGFVMGGEIAMKWLPQMRTLLRLSKEEGITHLYRTGLNPYKVLGVPPNATAEEIKAAYRTLAKAWHPSVGEKKGLSKELSGSFMDFINYAYRDLTADPAHRMALNEWLKNGMKGPRPVRPTLRPKQAPPESFKIPGPKPNAANAAGAGRSAYEQPHPYSGTPGANPHFGSRNPYAVLDLPMNATAEQIRAARKALTRQWHPDLVKSRGGDVDEATAKMSEINHAFDELEKIANNPRLRREFDEWIRSGMKGERPRM